MKRSESKESVASSARALTMLCHWGNCKVKEDDGMQAPYVRVRLKVSARECLPFSSCNLLVLEMQASNTCMDYRSRLPTNED